MHDELLKLGDSKSGEEQLTICEAGEYAVSALEAYIYKKNGSGSRANVHRLDFCGLISSAFRFLISVFTSWAWSDRP